MSKDIRQMIDRIKGLKPLNENQIRRKSRMITESTFSGKTIISVDIQPEYEDGIYFEMSEWTNFINESSNNNRIIFLYNGADTLGMIDERSYWNWLYEQGIEEEVLDDAIFYDKGYAFFRSCMDNSIEEDDMVALLKFMIKNDIRDSRDLDEEMWNEYVAETGNPNVEIREMLEDTGEAFWIPELMDFLENYSNIVLHGGGVDECLKEVELALMALDMNYNTYSRFTF